jgi:IS30 family transposase
MLSGKPTIDINLARKVKFTNPVKEQILKCLTNEKWSPELISIEGSTTGKCTIIIKSLYKWVSPSKHGNKSSDKPFKQINNLLKHGKRTRKFGSRHDTRAIIHNCDSIEKRPMIDHKRIRLGNVEVDFKM